MATWYYSLNGKAEGPVEETFIIEGLLAGRLTLVDLVFELNGHEWCTIGEVEVFRTAFHSLPPPSPPRELDATDPTLKLEEIIPQINTPAPSSSSANSNVKRFALKAGEDESTWVVLKPRNSSPEGPNDFEQTGPFSVEQILDHLGTGHIQYSQYAWREGYKRWVRIGNLPEFDRRKRDRDGDPVNQVVPLPAMSPLRHEPEMNAVSSAMTSNEHAPEEVMRQELTDSRWALKQELPPQEADGIDLTSDSFAINSGPGTWIAPELPLDTATDFNISSSATLEVAPPKFMKPALVSSGVNENALLVSEFDQSAQASSALNSGHDSDLDSGQELTSSEITEVSNVAEVSSERSEQKSPATLASLGADSGSAVQPPPISAASVSGKSQARSSFAKRAIRLFVAGAAAGLAIVAGLAYMAGRSGESAAPVSVEASETLLPPAVPPPNAAPPPPPPGAGANSALPSQDPALAQEGSGASDGLQAVSESKAGAPAGEASAAPTQSTVAGSAPTASNKDGAPSVEAPSSDQAVNGSNVTPVASGASVDSSLEIVPLRLSTQPQLVFQTSAAVGQVLEVRVTGRSGEILKFPGYSRTFKVTRSAGEMPSLDLASYKIPRGSYRVEVSLGESRKQVPIFIGTNDAQFGEELEVHLKAISAQQQAERKALYYSALAYEKLGLALGDNFRKLRSQPKSWQSYYARWKKDSQAAGAPVMGLASFQGADPEAAFAYPEEVAQFKRAVQLIAEQAQQMDAAVSQRRDIATVKTPTVVKEFERIKIEATQLRNYPDEP